MTLATLLRSTLGLLFAPTVLVVPASATAPAGLEAAPLAPRSGPRGATLFATVAPESSGVVAENNYADPEMWGRRAREFDLGGIGTGVAVGDVDGDGRPDLFIVSKTESCRLYRNLGDWRFEDITERAGVGDTGPAAKIWKQGATFADVNNDGHLDLYLCRFGAPNLLYLNQGDGTFRESAQAAGLDVKDASVMATFADYDRDGWLDVFVQTNVLDAAARPEGERDRLFHNDGDGTFTDVTTSAGVAPGPTHGNSALWWDFDGDGWLDLYVANDFALPDALFRNNRDGTFTDIIGTALPRLPYSSMGSDLGDVDGDGRLDLLVADMAATTHVKDQRTMAESRARLRPPAAGSSEVAQFPASALALNTGTGRCLEIAHLAGVAATDWTWSPRWEDFDDDGRIDLHVTNGMYREIHNMDLIGRRMSAGSPAAAGQATRASPMLAEQNFAFRNSGNPADPRLEDVSTAWGLAHVGVSFGSATGDLDGDGDLDLLYTNYQTLPTLLRNDNNTGHRLVCALRGTRSNRHGIGAKLTVETQSRTQVRVVMLARGFMASSEPVAHFGLGSDDVVRRLTVTWPSGTVQVFADLAADQRLTITEPAASEAPPSEGAGAEGSHTHFEEVGAASGLRFSAEEELYDEFLDQRLLPMTFNRRGPAIAVGDIDGSGRDSICLGGTTRTPLRVLAAQDAQPHAPIASTALAEPPYVNDGPLLLFDAAGRGRADLLVTAGGASLPDGSPEYQPRLFLNDGNGHFEPAPDGAMPALSISAGAACAADFDRDGRLDVFIGGRVSPGLYPTAPTSALLVNRGPEAVGFADATDTVVPSLRRVGMVTAALWSDVDGDSWPDLLVALEWGEVKYFHNEGGRAFADWTEQAGFAAAGTGWWRSIAAADFNGDGRPDYAVGNLGENTPYRATADQPALLYSGDFAGRGSAEIVEAYFEGGAIYPRRCRTDLGAAIPAVFRRYRANNDFAKATLPEILGTEPLAAATRLAATESRSGTFLSQPNGRYRFEPWPRVAQVAPANGLVAGDFDGDGHADLYVVHNSHAPAPVHGRFDGGLSQLLRGDPEARDGGFVPVPPIASGMVVPGDARALSVLDLDQDGWPDCVISRSGEPALAFRNRTQPGRQSVRVTLQGMPGNAQAIGARVTAEYADGATRTEEVHAGSGSSSQSTPAIFFGSTGANPLRRVRVRWPSGEVTTGPDWSGSLPASLRIVQE